MAGYIKLHRGWRDSTLFKGEFSRADAWVWLIENACWKPTKARIKGATVMLERGELSFSQRFMADKWGWSKSRVDRFISELQAENMIEISAKSRGNSGATTGATAGHPAGQGASIVRLCNYEKYQGVEDDERGNAQSETGASAFEKRGEEEEGRRKKEDNKGEFAFSGCVIRLTAADYQRWQRAFPDLDLLALLTSRDDWLSDRPLAERKRWFQSTSAWLANRQQEAARLAHVDPMEGFIV